MPANRLNRAVHQLIAALHLVLVPASLTIVFTVTADTLLLMLLTTY